MKTKILITIKDGLISSIGCTDPGNTEVIVVDYDTFENATTENGAEIGTPEWYDIVAANAVNSPCLYQMKDNYADEIEILPNDLLPAEERNQLTAVRKQLQKYDPGKYCFACDMIHTAEETVCQKCGEPL